MFPENSSRSVAVSNPGRAQSPNVNSALLYAQSDENEDRMISSCKPADFFLYFLCRRPKNWLPIVDKPKNWEFTDYIGDLDGGALDKE
jgi:hypothetical protein